MGGIDHDVRAELASDRARLGFAGVCGTQDAADLLDGVDPFVHERQALFRTSFCLERIDAVRGFVTGHKLDNLIELSLGKLRSECAAERPRGTFRDREPKRL